MPGNLFFSEMTTVPDDPIITVVTCEGDLHDPLFPLRLQYLVSGLQRRLCTGSKGFCVTKLEPWNSVRVTFQIPREAAQRLRQLAQQGDRVLRDLGILSVQIEGDQVISLTIAGRYNEPQEIVLRTDGESHANSSTTSLDLSGSEGSPGPSNVETTRKNIAQYLSQQGSVSSAAAASATVCGSASVTASTSTENLGGTSDFFLTSTLNNAGRGEFKSPNVVAPGSEPIPFPPPRTLTTTVSRAPGSFGPFPFASMTHAAINTMHGSQNHLQASQQGNVANTTTAVVAAPNAAITTTAVSVAGTPARFPFSSPPPPYPGTSNPAPVALNQLQHHQPTAVPAAGLQPGYGQPPTSAPTLNNMPRGLVGSTGLVDRPSVALSSPLLVNLLQSDLSTSTSSSSSSSSSLGANSSQHLNKLFPPPSQQQELNAKRKRKPRRPKERLTDSGGLLSSSPVTSPLMSPLSPASSTTPTTPGTPVPEVNYSTPNNQPFSISLPIMPSIPLSPPLTHNLVSNQTVNSIPVLNTSPALCAVPETPLQSAPDNSSSQEKELSPWPSPSKRTQHLINPFTGQLEPMPSDDDESIDSFPSNEYGKLDSSNNSLFADIDQEKNDSDKSSKVDGEQHSQQTFASELPLHDNAAGKTNSISASKGELSPSSSKGSPASMSSGSPGEKIKLRLKIDPKSREGSTKESKERESVRSLYMEKQKVESGSSPATVQYKVDVSFVNIPTMKKASACSYAAGSVSPSSSLPPAGEPRVPPLHISLRGRNAMVVGSMRKDDKERTNHQQHSKEQVDQESIKNESLFTTSMSTRSQRSKVLRGSRSLDGKIGNGSGSSSGRRGVNKVEGSRRGRNSLQSSSGLIPTSSSLFSQASTTAIVSISTESPSTAVVSLVTASTATTLTDTVVCTSIDGDSENVLGLSSGLREKALLSGGGIVLAPTETSPSQDMGIVSKTIQVAPVVPTSNTSSVISDERDEESNDILSPAVAGEGNSLTENSVENSLKSSPPPNPLTSNAIECNIKQNVQTEHSAIAKNSCASSTPSPPPSPSVHITYTPPGSLVTDTEHTIAVSNSPCPTVIDSNTASLLDTVTKVKGVCVADTCPELELKEQTVPAVKSAIIVEETEMKSTKLIESDERGVSESDKLNVLLRDNPTQKLGLLQESNEENEALKTVASNDSVFETKVLTDIKPTESHESNSLGVKIIADAILQPVTVKAVTVDHPVLEAENLKMVDSESNSSSASPVPDAVDISRQSSNKMLTIPSKEPAEIHVNKRDLIPKEPEELEEEDMHVTSIDLRPGGVVRHSEESPNVVPSINAPTLSESRIKAKDRPRAVGKIIPVSVTEHENERNELVVSVKVEVNPSTENSLSENINVNSFPDSQISEGPGGFNNVVNVSCSGSYFVKNIEKAENVASTVSIVSQNSELQKKDCVIDHSKREQNVPVISVNPVKVMGQFALSPASDGRLETMVSSSASSSSVNEDKKQNFFHVNHLDHEIQEENVSKSDEFYELEGKIRRNSLERVCNNVIDNCTQENNWHEASSPVKKTCGLNNDNEDSVDTDKASLSSAETIAEMTREDVTQSLNNPLAGIVSVSLPNMLEVPSTDVEQSITKIAKIGSIVAPAANTVVPNLIPSSGGDHVLVSHLSPLQTGMIGETEYDTNIDASVHHHHHINSSLRTTIASTKTISRKFLVPGTVSTTTFRNSSVRLVNTASTMSERENNNSLKSHDIHSDVKEKINCSDGGEIGGSEGEGGGGSDGNSSGGGGYDKESNHDERLSAKDSSSSSGSSPNEDSGIDSMDAMSEKQSENESDPAKGKEELAEKDDDAKSSEDSANPLDGEKNSEHNVMSNQEKSSTETETSKTEENAEDKEISREMDDMVFLTALSYNSNTLNNNNTRLENDEKDELISGADGKIKDNLINSPSHTASLIPTTGQSGTESSLLVLCEDNDGDKHGDRKEHSVEIITIVSSDAMMKYEKSESSDVSLLAKEEKDSLETGSSVFVISSLSPDESLPADGQNIALVENATLVTSSSEQELLSENYYLIEASSENIPDDEAGDELHTETGNILQDCKMDIIISTSDNSQNGEESFPNGLLSTESKAFASVVHQPFIYSESGQNSQDLTASVEMQPFHSVQISAESPEMGVLNQHVDISLTPLPENVTVTGGSFYSIGAKKGTTSAHQFSGLPNLISHPFTCTSNTTHGMTMSHCDKPSLVTSVSSLISSCSSSLSSLPLSSASSSSSCSSSSHTSDSVILHDGELSPGVTGSTKKQSTSISPNCVSSSLCTTPVCNLLSGSHTVAVPIKLVTLPTVVQPNVVVMTDKPIATSSPESKPESLALSPSGSSHSPTIVPISQPSLANSANSVKLFVSASSPLPSAVSSPLSTSAMSSSQESSAPIITLSAVVVKSVVVTNTSSTIKTVQPQVSANITTTHSCQVPVVTANEQQHSHCRQNSPASGLETPSSPSTSESICTSVSSAANSISCVPVCSMCVKSATPVESIKTSLETVATTTAPISTLAGCTSLVTAFTANTVVSAPVVSTSKLFSAPKIDNICGTASVDSDAGTEDLLLVKSACCSHSLQSDNSNDVVESSPLNACASTTSSAAVTIPSAVGDCLTLQSECSLQNDYKTVPHDSSSFPVCLAPKPIGISERPALSPDDSGSSTELDDQLCKKEFASDKGSVATADHNYVYRISCDSEGNPDDDGSLLQESNDQIEPDSDVRHRTVGGTSIGLSQAVREDKIALDEREASLHYPSCLVEDECQTKRVTIKRDIHLAEDEQVAIGENYCSANVHNEVNQNKHEFQIGELEDGLSSNRNERLSSLTIETSDEDHEDQRSVHNAAESISRSGSPISNVDSQLSPKSNSPEGILENRLLDDDLSEESSVGVPVCLVNSPLALARALKRKREDSGSEADHRKEALSPSSVIPDGEDSKDGLSRSLDTTISNIKMLYYAKPLKRRSSENAAELIKACMGVDDNPKRLNVMKHRSSLDDSSLQDKSKSIEKPKLDEKIEDDISSLAAFKSNRCTKFKKEDNRRGRGISHIIGSGESSDEELTLSELASKTKTSKPTQSILSSVGEEKNLTRNAYKVQNAKEDDIIKLKDNRTDRPNNRINNRGREETPSRGTVRGCRDTPRRDLRRSTSAVGGSGNMTAIVTNVNDDATSKEEKGLRFSRSSERSRKSPPRVREKSPPRVGHSRGRGRDQERTSPSPQCRDEEIQNKRKTRSSGTSECYDSLPQKRRRYSRDHR